MFDHVTIRVSDRGESRRFYSTVLDLPPVQKDDFDEWNDFSIAAGEPTTGLHVAFAAWSKTDVDAFWQRGVDAGYRSDGEPGPRPQYAPEYYGGFLLDPDGNSVEAVFHGRQRGRGGLVDHLWIGVSDLEASRRFWATVAPSLGLRVGAGHGDHVHVEAGDRSFALVADGRPPTRNLHVAFPVRGDDAVAAFHATAVAAGYRDNGGPGERPHYHPGYVAAFVLDPDGTNVEAVDHNRRSPEVRV